MRIIFIYILLLLLLVEMGNSKPIYNTTQLRLILNSHCKMIPAFPEILGIHIYDNKEVKVIIIASNGNVFCSGHNLKEITAARNSNDKGESYFMNLDLDGLRMDLDGLEMDSDGLKLDLAALRMYLDALGVDLDCLGVGADNLAADLDLLGEIQMF